MMSFCRLKIELIEEPHEVTGVFIFRQLVVKHLYAWNVNGTLAVTVDGIFLLTINV